MSNKLTVNQLRSQLTQRGLDSSGTKPLLVQRLDAALLIENKADETNELLVNNKKRKRESKEEDEDLIVKDLEKLNQFSIKQLREQATLRGIPTNGSKKQLLERISAHDSLTQEEDVGGDKNLVKVMEEDEDILDQKVMSEDGGVKKVEDVEELCEMGIRQLREQAALRGVLTSGTKKQLLERLCADSLSGAEENAEKVALGDMAEYTAAYQGAYNLPFGKLSTKGVGRTIPNPYEYKVLDDGVIVPFGKPMNTMTGGQLLYNEYIVYNVDQIRMRYVIQVNFNLNCRKAY